MEPAAEPLGPPQQAVVTGAAGFLGGRVVRLLLGMPEVARVIGIDARPPLGAPRDPRFLPQVADLRVFDPGLLAGADTVLHFAFRLQPSHRAAVDHQVNVGATARLLAACAAAGVGHFVYPSSATVYGAPPGGARPHPETDPLQPEPGFRYGTHKMEVESLLEGFAAAHPEVLVTILRPCVVLAPGAANFVTDLLRLRLLPVPAGADPEMQFLHADDLSAAVRAVLERRAGGVFNLAGKGTVRWREAIRLTGGRILPLPARLLAVAADLSWRARLQRRSPSEGINLIRYPWLADTTAARQGLGWEPRYSSRQVVELWKEGMARRPPPSAPLPDSAARAGE
jgi:UDP-glucose 4-epimerase